MLALPVKSTNRLLWSGEDRFFGPRDMILVDVSAPYVYGWHDDGASYAFHVDFKQLGLPMDTIRTATSQIHTSPLYPLVRNHIIQVTTEAQRLVDSGAANEIGAASAELMHALIVSAARDQRRLGDTMHASLAARVQTYVRHHLGDPDLGASQIAATNGLSVRALYNLYETLGTSIEQSIIRQRLEGARSDLTTTLRLHRRARPSVGLHQPELLLHPIPSSVRCHPRQWRNGIRPTPVNAPAG